MKIAYPLIFTFGEIISEPIAVKSRDKYLNLCKHFFGANITWANGLKSDLDDLFYTINIYKQSPYLMPDILAHLTLEWLINKAKIISEDNFKIEDQVILIFDLTGIDRDQQIYHLSLLLNTLVSTNDNLLIILILEQLPRKEDRLYKHVFDLHEKKVLVYVDKIDDLLIETQISEINGNLIQINKIYPEQLNEQTLKAKLIRKIGHFKPDASRNMCSRHFYDARYCDKDVRKLTLEYILSSKIDLKNLEYIFYISKVSPWLKQSMSALSGDIEADLKHVFKSFKGAFNHEQIDSKIANAYKGGHILLVADFINHGRALKYAIANILSNIAGLSNENLHLLSILNNSKKGYSIGNIRTLQDGDVEYKIPFFVEVPIEETDPKDCNLCRLKLVHNDLYEDNFLKLRSYDFWEISDENGYDYETFKPGYPERKRLYSPIFFNWLNDNAAYLAYKLHRFLEKENIKTNVNLVIIYPDETLGRDGEGFEINQTASGNLANKLTEIFKTKAIGIPRNVIDEVTSGELKSNDFERLSEEWTKSIGGLPVNTNIVVIDEFHSSGKTFESIRDIVKWLGFDTKCFFTVADFNPNKTKEYKLVDSSIEFFNLYEFTNSMVL